MQSRLTCNHLHIQSFKFSNFGLSICTSADSFCSPRTDRMFRRRNLPFNLLVITGSRTAGCASPRILCSSLAAASRTRANITEVLFISDAQLILIKRLKKGLHLLLLLYSASHPLIVFQFPPFLHVLLLKLAMLRREVPVGQPADQLKRRWR